MNSNSLSSRYDDQFILRYRKVSYDESFVVVRKDGAVI